MCTYGVATQQLGLPAETVLSYLKVISTSYAGTNFEKFSQKDSPSVLAQSHPIYSVSILLQLRIDDLPITVDTNTSQLAAS